MTEETCTPTHYGDQAGPVTGTAPYYVPCCGCLQFDKACNSQYLGAA